MKLLKEYSVLFLIIALILEIMIFNFRAIITMGYKEIDISDYESSNSVSYNADGSLSINGNSGYIEIKNINQKLHNLYIDIYNTDVENKEKEKTLIKISATDEANKLYFDLPEKAVVSTVERTKYINLNLSGKSENIKININNADNGSFKINKIAFNSKVPFNFNILRFVIIFIILMLCYILRPHSEIYEIKINLTFAQIIVIFLLMIFNVVTVILGTSAENPVNAQGHHRQYQELADALTEGKFYIDDEVSQALMDMENPYDTDYRKTTLDSVGESFRWDTAYYDGKYYVYFGITPALLFYLPYKLMTQTDLQNYFVTCFCGILASIGVYFFLYEIIRKWFKQTPFVIYLMLCQTFIYGCGTVLIMRYPDLYYVPISVGLMLTVWGLYFWMKAVAVGSAPKIKAVPLCIGSVFMALVAGARPQMLVGSFLAIPLFWNLAFKDKQLFAKKSILNTICFILPYIIFAAVIMYYNYSRFNSPFDFGANYNLTTNDMTHRGIRAGRIGLGLFTYLFQMPVISAKFPYINPVNFYTEYMGTTIKESLMGGVFAAQTITLLNFAVFKVKDVLKDKNLFYFCLALILFGFIVPVVDAQMGGLLQRYSLDFVWIWLLGAVIIALAMIEKAKFFTKYNFIYIVYGIIIFTVLCGLLYDIALFFAPMEQSLNNINPKLFYSVKYAVEFWQ